MSIKVNQNITKDVVSTYAYDNLDLLRESEEFKKQLIGTGENESLLLVRRYSFRKPKIFIEPKDDLSVVDIGVTYGISGKTTLLTVDRTIYTARLDEKTGERIPFARLYVKNPDALLCELEPELNSLFSTRGIILPEDIRMKPVSQFLTKASPYCFILNLKVDTLSLYADVSIEVAMSYVYIEDAVKGIVKELMNCNILSQDTSKTFFVMLDDENDVTYVNRYKRHVSMI